MRKKSIKASLSFPSGCPNVDWPEWAWLESRLTTRRPPIEYIDLTDCSAVTDAGLCALLHTCPSLQYLYLRRCTLVTGKIIEISFSCLITLAYIFLYLFLEGTSKFVTFNWILQNSYRNFLPPIYITRIV